MKRLALAAATLAILSAPAFAADCAKDYRDFFNSFGGGASKDLTTAQVAMVNRQALRAMDACNAGDEASAKSIFEKIKDAAPAKGADFWQQLGNMGGAAKK